MDERTAFESARRKSLFFFSTGCSVYSNVFVLFSSILITLGNDGKEIVLFVIVDNRVKR